MRKEEFAIKSISKSIILESPSLLVIISFNEKNHLENEINFGRKLNHQNISHLIEVFESKSEIHLVFEFIDGIELSEIISTGFKFSEERTAQIFEKIFNILQYLESMRIVHRDIKAENIIIKYRKHKIFQKWFN